MHLYIGQEAVSTGLISLRQPQDRVITAYRDHGVAINCGIPAKLVMAELLGKATGVSHGKGGSMHMADVNKNFWGGHAIVGAHLPIAAGLALGDLYQHNDGVTICMFGDGATNIGYFHEALNLSKVWNLPVLWVCENNQYGMGTAVERASAVSEIRQKAEGYCIPSNRVDGMDVMDVRKVAGEALEYIRSGRVPSSWRSRPTASAAIRWATPNATARPEEVKCWQEENDPIGIYRKYLLDQGIATEAELDALDVKSARRRSRRPCSLPKPAPNRLPKTLFKNIYADS